MNSVKEDLKKQIEEKLMRDLTDQEKDFVSWMAKRSIENSEAIMR